jgi:hypothetical protein
MSTNSHTPLPFGGPLTSAAMEAPLGQLDAAIAQVITTGSGASTTLTAQANAGQASLTVASSAGFVPGDPIYIGTGATFESRIVNTVPGGGVTITVTVNLTNTYAIGKPVSKSPVEIVAARAGSTTLGGRLALMEVAVNVKTHGATGNGSTDDTAAIAAAITAAGVGGVIRVPLGTYKVSAPLTLLSKQTIFGDGWGSSIVAVAGTLTADGTGGPVLGNTTDINDIAIRNLSITGFTGTSANSSPHLIGALRPNRWRIEDVKFIGSAATCWGVLFDGGSDNTIRGCDFADLSYGTVIGTVADAAYACDRNLVAACNFRNIALNPVYLTNSIWSPVSTAHPKDNAVIGNQMDGWGDCGIESGAGCYGSVIVGNTLSGGTGIGNVGIIVRDNVDTIVNDNVIRNVSQAGYGDGISILPIYGQSINIVIAGNTVSGCTGNGLAIGADANITVTGGSYHDNALNGINVGAAASLQMTGVLAYFNGLEGFLLNGVQRALLTGCIAHDNSLTTVNAADGFRITGGSFAVRLVGCMGYDIHTAGTERQRYGMYAEGGTSIEEFGGKWFNNKTAPIGNFITTNFTQGAISSPMEIQGVSGGIVLTSPNGTRYIAKMANGGTWVITAA